MIHAAHEPTTGFQNPSHTSSAEILSHVLSETYTLFLKTQYCHWNVSGPVYLSLHILFEEQYQEMFKAIDELAERIRYLGEIVPTNFMNIAQKTRIDEHRGFIEYQEMICDLGFATHAVMENLRGYLIDVQDSGDIYTYELLKRRLEAHEKNLWRLQSFLQ